MINQLEKKGLQVRGRIELTAPHLDEERTFIYPPLKGNGAECAQQLSQQWLYPPTLSEIVSLVYAAWQNKDEKYSKEIIKLIRVSSLRSFTAVHYVPEGAYIQDYPQIKNGRIVMYENDLTKKLELNDPTVRFVPFGYKIGSHSSSELAKNPFIIGQTSDEEQAEKLGEIADNYKDSPYLWAFASADDPITRVSRLGSSYVGKRLSVYAGGRGSDGVYTFGLVKNLKREVK